MIFGDVSRLGYVVEDIHAALECWIWIVGERFYCLGNEMHPSTVAEIGEAGELKRQFFSFLQDEAARWDGSDPIRPQFL